MRIRITLACMLAVGALSSCNCGDKKTDQKADAAGATAKVVVVNTVCPVGGDEFGNAPSSTRTFKGTSIGFCCDHCTAKFDKMTDAEKENVINLAKANKVLKSN